MRTPVLVALLPVVAACGTDGADRETGIQDAYFEAKYRGVEWRCTDGNCPGTSLTEGWTFAQTQDFDPEWGNLTLRFCNEAQAVEMIVSQEGDTMVSGALLDDPDEPREVLQLRITTLSEELDGVLTSYDPASLSEFTLRVLDTWTLHARVTDDAPAPCKSN